MFVCVSPSATAAGDEYVSSGGASGSFQTGQGTQPHANLSSDSQQPRASGQQPGLGLQKRADPTASTQHVSSPQLPEQSYCEQILQAMCTAEAATHTQGAAAAQLQQISFPLPKAFFKPGRC